MTQGGSHYNLLTYIVDFRIGSEKNFTTQNQIKTTSVKFSIYCKFFNQVREFVTKLFSSPSSNVRKIKMN